MDTLIKTTRIDAPEGKQELCIHRDFDAPRELVYRAFTEAALISRWLGPAGMDTVVEKLDNSSHGSWRFVHRDADGNEHAFNGVIHEVCAPERVIRTFEWEGMPERGHVSLEFLTLEALPLERTKMTIQVIYRSVADRDGHVQAGMERGVQDSHKKLDTLLETLKQQ